MSEKIIVLVSDPGDSKHGEISVLDDTGKAERLVEALLQAGFGEERIHVFSGRESEFQVSQRPVVALVEEGWEDEPRATGGFSSQEAGREAPPEVEKAESESGEEAESEGEEEPASAETAGPVRFSSLFRSA